jgi:hypothetical protein
MRMPFFRLIKCRISSRKIIEILAGVEIFGLTLLDSKIHGARNEQNDPHVHLEVAHHAA